MIDVDREARYIVDVLNFIFTGEKPLPPLFPNKKRYQIKGSKPLLQNLCSASVTKPKQTWPMMKS